jgi:hypothetical protein
MAAKQGLTAQLSQAGEDAKRAVLSRTGVTSSWFSNLNTVCTIKSAPPRSPEVLQMLAIKSGWLYKRNEQHVWQSRWCCVVPHMFLYYFDANIGHNAAAIAEGEALPLKCTQNPTPSQQEDWNKAVQMGYGNRKQHEKRSSLYLFNQSNTTTTATPSATNNNASSSANASAAGDASYPHHHQHNENSEGSGGGGSGTGGAGGGGGLNTAGGLATGPPDASKFTTLQPAGIIDLECYTSVHRSTENDLVLELAGDDQVNPDLRAFYFCAADQEDREDWTSALLNERHAALVDECEAYKQVCEGFALQLQALHSDLDQARLHWSEAQDELYRVRSQQEENRRVTWRLLEENMEKPCHCPPLDGKRNELRASLDRVRSQDLGIQAAVRMLLEYAGATEEVAADLHQQKQRLEDDWKETGQSDQAKVEEMREELEELRGKYDQEKKQWESQLEAATAKYEQSQKELHDVQKDLSSTRMEVTMYQSQQRTKMSELQQHKKILKKEVIGLRTRVENAEAELNLMRHKQENHQMQAEQERQKNALLERYVEKIESQVKVQQNMMEMMSTSGSVMGGCVGGGGGGNNSVSQFDHYSSPRSRVGGNVVYVRSSTPTEQVPAEHDDDNDDDDDDDEEDVAEPLRPVMAVEHHGSSSHNHRTSTNNSSSRRRHNMLDELDNKSHVSELTEDRTQRHYEYSQQQQQDFLPYHGPRSKSSSSRIPGRSPRGGAGPPSFIIGPNSSSSAATATTANKNNNNDINKGNGGGGGTKHSLATINSGGATTTSSGGVGKTPPARRSEIPRSGGRGGGDNMSVSSESRKLSVAQRARRDADLQSTPVRVRAETAKAALEQQRNTKNGGVLGGPTSGSSSLSPTRVGTHHQQPGGGGGGGSGESVGSQNSMWRRMENAIVGVSSGGGRQSAPPDDVFSSDGDDDDGDDSSTIQSTRVTDYTDEDKKMSDSVSVSLTVDDTNVSPNLFVSTCTLFLIILFFFLHITPQPALSLAERQKIQRAKQLEFLQEQGLIKSKSEVAQSATTGSSTVDDGNTSVSSTNMSYAKAAASLPGRRI